MKKKKKKQATQPNPPIMRKAHTHKNEDAKLYSRKKTKKEERDAQEEE